MTSRAKKVDATMDTLIFNPELWLAIGFILLVVEMTLDGSFLFFLPLGIGCAFTAAGLYGCSESSAGICFAYDSWYSVFVSTALGAGIGAVSLRSITRNDQSQKNDIDKY